MGYVRTKGKNKSYTKSDLEFVKSNFEHMTDKEIGDHIGRSAKAIKTLRQKHGWITKRNYWTDEEMAIVAEHYSDTDNEVILEMLPGRTISGLYHAAQKLGINKSDEYMENQRQELAHRLGELGLGHRFKKGDIPYNKGMKQEDYMSPEAIEKCKETQFPKGHKPHNAKFDGAVSLRSDSSGMQYLWIRISESNWQEYHRYLWEKHNGEIPEGKIIVFKDGNQMNCSLDNLEAITRREHADRNRDWEKSMQTMMENGNHSSIHLTDSFVASHLAGHDKELKEHILQHKPELIKAARANYKLKRAIRHGDHEH